VNIRIFKIFKVINFITILELIAWYLAFKQHIFLCLLLVILADIIENFKENQDIKRLENEVKELKNKINKFTV
jgi:hypothetical protein